MKSLIVLCALIVLCGFIGCSKERIETPEQMAAKSAAFEGYKSLKAEDIVEIRDGRRGVVLVNYPKHHYVMLKSVLTGEELTATYHQLWDLESRLIKVGTVEWRALN